MDKQSKNDDVHGLITQALKYGPIDPLRKNGVLSYFKHALNVILARDKFADLPGPISIQIEATNHCNTRCAMCFRYLPASPKIDYLTVEEIKHVCIEARALGTKTVVFSGGEPTTRDDDFIAMLINTKSIDLSIGVLTNGLALSDQMIATLVKTCSWVRVSVDAGKPETYEVVRGVKNGFDKVITNIKKLIALRDKNSINKTKIGASITVQRANINDVELFLKLGHSIGLDRIDIKFVHGHNSPVATKKQLSLLSDKFQKWIDKNSYPKAGIGWALFQLRGNLDGIANGLPAEQLYEMKNEYNCDLRVQNECFAPYLTMIISPFGAVYPCCHLFEDNEGYWESTEKRRSKYFIGSVREHTLKDIWIQYYKPFRQEAKTILTNVKSNSCGRCTRYSPHNIPLSRLYYLWRYACALIGEENAYKVFSSFPCDDSNDVFI
ncbi:Radical SAM domain protein [Candidatus Magnetomorum sp. HK-1]|nr:Radical SAM domain protein [Candidatus Magnetomorum sp. HK-1]